MRAHRARSRRCRWPTSAACSRLPRPPRRQVGLERHLHHHRAARARHLGQQRRRVGDVLEHVREDAELVRAVGRGQMQRRRSSSTESISSRARAISTAASVISTPTAARRSRGGAARTGARRRRSRPRACWSVGGTPCGARTARSRGRPCRARPAPASARTRAGRGRSLRVGVVVEADESGGVLHTGDYCGRDDSASSRRRCARRPRRCRRSRRSRCSSCGRPSQAGYPLTHWAPGALIVLALLGIALGDRAGARARRCRRAVRIALGRAGRVHRAQLPLDPVGGGARATRGKEPTARCCTCSCSRCSPAGASAEPARRCCSCAWTLALIALAAFTALHLDAAGPREPAER